MLLIITSLVATVKRARMTLIFRLQGRQLLKYMTPQSSVVNLGRPYALTSTPAPSPQVLGHDERNMKIGRPMSPHLTIYKPQITSMLSISHRGTGMGMGCYLAALGLGALVLPQSIDHYLDNLQGIGWFTHFVIKMFIGFPLCYHYINGIRHLAWDMGKLLTIKEVYTSGYVMLAAAIVSSVILCL